MLLLAVAAASAGQTGILAFLPTLVDHNPVDASPRVHDLNVALLTAIHPLAALLFAPLWGWLADRMDYRISLRTALILLALVIAPIGTVSVPALYLLRIGAGIAAAAIIPLALLSASFSAQERSERAQRFAWLTAFVFLGDMVGPILAEAGARLTPRTPLLMMGLAVSAIAIALCFVRLPDRCVACPVSSLSKGQSQPVAAMLLLIAMVSGGGLAAMHVDLLVSRADYLLDREEIALMLSLCGLAMLAAQLFHQRVPWVVTAPRLIACTTLALLAGALLTFSHISSVISTAGVIITAGWSSASLRLVTSFWISGAGLPSGWKLGLQHAAASIGQALAPLAIAFAEPAGRPSILTGIGGISILMLFALPFVWRREPQRTVEG